MGDYETQRQANIDRNQRLLESLGLNLPFFGEKVKKPATEKPQKKRKSVAVDDDGTSTPSAPKVARLDTGNPAESGARRSARNIGKTVDYSSEQLRVAPRLASIQSGIRTVDNSGPMGSEGGKRKHDPKTFGSIPGVEVGTWWQTREGCSADAIHAPWVAGIAPSKNGAYSVALSGGYDDDVDLGYAFTYTGSGGRDLKGTKDAPKNLRTAPQSSDQSFDNNFNYSLKRSAETKKPVRVIRGYKLKSKYAPTEGYRYDGLYQVEKAWMERGLNKHGYQVCKFAFKRLGNQPPLPERGKEIDEVSSDDDTKSGTAQREAAKKEEKSGAEASIGDAVAREENMGADNTQAISREGGLDAEPALGNSMKMDDEQAETSDS